MRTIEVRVQFEPRDLWVGLYWQKFGNERSGWICEIFICLLPMVPIVLTITRSSR